MNKMSPKENADSAIHFVKKYYNCPYPKQTVEDCIVAAIMQDLLNSDVCKRNWAKSEDITSEEDFNHVLETWRIIVRDFLKEFKFVEKNND